MLAGRFEQLAVHRQERGRLMIVLRTVQCPYCGEPFEANVDPSGGSQEYIEDCYVCCRPIVFRVTVDGDGELSAVETCREDD